MFPPIVTDKRNYEKEIRLNQNHLTEKGKKEKLLLVVVLLLRLLLLLRRSRTLFD